MFPRSISRAAFACCRRRLIFTPCITPRTLPVSLRQQNPPQWRPHPNRAYATLKSLADEKIEEIQEQYATAKDEFEIAVEETEKKTVYAADDRAAAQEEVKKLKELFDEAVGSSEPDVASEIRSRVGQRIRELDHAIQGLEEAAKRE